MGAVTDLQLDKLVITYCTLSYTSYLKEPAGILNKPIYAKFSMELTIEQALQKAVEAHKAGQVQEADRLYTAILKARPKHPDANHNLGVLAVSVGKVEEALPFFKAALEANPSIARFWLSYINALIRLIVLAMQRLCLDQAKSKGRKG